MLKKDDDTDYEALSSALQISRVTSGELADTWGYRIHEIDNLEDEIINNYVNHPGFRLSNSATLQQCSQVMNVAQSCLERIYHIEMNSIKIETILVGNKNPLMNAITTALGTGGSAGTREAKASSAMEQINLLLTLELGLQRICDNAKKNASKAWETASRTQTAIENDYKYNDRGLTQETIEKIKNETKWK